MRRIRLLFAVSWAMVLLTSATLHGQQGGPLDAKKSEEEAQAVLKRTVAFIAQAKSFR